MTYLCPDLSTPPWLVLLLSFEKEPEVLLWVPKNKMFRRKKLIECTEKPQAPAVIYFSRNTKYIAYI